MRTINKKIIILSIILATVFVNNSQINAQNIKRSSLHKDYELVNTNKTAIENSLKESDYNLFTGTLKTLGINETVTSDQFNVLVNAYSLFKSGKKDDAIKLLKDNKVNPILIKFVSNRSDLTTNQKEGLKQVSNLIKQGKLVEAKALMSSLGLSYTSVLRVDKKIQKVESKENRKELKKAFDTARTLKKEGRIDEAKKVLKDAGVPDQIQGKIRLGDNVVSSTTNKFNFFQSLKRLFIQ